MGQIIVRVESLSFGPIYFSFVYFFKTFFLPKSYFNEKGRESYRLFLRRHDTRHNDTQHNNTQDNNTQHNNTQYNDTQHNATQDNDTQPNDTQDNDIQYDNK
jgi:hypothetical protein